MSVDALRRLLADDDEPDAELTALGEALMADLEHGDQLSLLGAEPVTFVPAGPRSLKVACSACGRKGYAGGPWQDDCRRGHGSCPRCGRIVGLRLDGLARVHTRCPANPPANTTEENA